MKGSAAEKTKVSIKLMKVIEKSVINGAILGLICIVGVGTRLGYAGNEVFLFATWFNRVLMGLVVGLSAKAGFMKKSQIRGALLGLLVSFAWFATSLFRDIPGFLAGILYGIILDYLARKN